MPKAFYPKKEMNLDGLFIDVNTPCVKYGEDEILFDHDDLVSLDETCMPLYFCENINEWFYEGEVTQEKYNKIINGFKRYQKVIRNGQ